MLLVNMSIILYLHHLILECSLLDKQEFPLILYDFLRLLDLMLILEVVLGYSIALLFPLAEPLLNTLDAADKVTLLEVPLLESDDLVLAVARDCFFE